MSAAKAKKAKAKKTKAKKAKAKPAKAKSANAKTTKVERAKPDSTRPFRFTAAQTVQIRFAGEKKLEAFRIDDMVEANLVTLGGETKLYFQYRLISNHKQNQDGSDRCFWFLDPKPVGLAGSMAPSLWKPVSEQTLDGYDVVKSHSGNFSTKSVTSYDGSGSLHVVKLNDKPLYRMRLDLNSQREFCESLPVAIGKGDVLSVPD
jgi:hypothetical protein